ncbi:MAG: ribonuclease P protein component [Paracoccaceae bacterium]|jgi:ribonuclease P protein component
MERGSLGQKTIETAKALPLAVSMRTVVLSKRADFLRVARARRQACPAFLIQARRRDPEEPSEAPVRVGFTCSKKVGNAVARNRAKRRLRALAQAVLPDAGREGWDYVLVGRKDATASRDFSLMLEDLRRAIESVHRSKK